MNKKDIQDIILLNEKEQPIAESFGKTINGISEEEYASARYETFQEKMASRQMSQSRRAEETYRSKAGRKLVLALGIMIILVALLTISVVAFNPFKKFFEIFDINDFAKGSEISYSETYSPNAFLHGTYSYLPKGYRLKKENVGKNYHEQFYESNAGTMIQTSTLLAEDSTSVLNTEGTTPREIKVGENEGLYLKTKEGFQVVQWVTGQYVNILNTDDEGLTPNELIKIAESRIKFNT